MATNNVFARPQLSSSQRFIKRTFDILFAFIGLLLTFWIIIIAAFIATIDTRKFGIFIQERVGRGKKRFKILKIRTMRDMPHVHTSVTQANDSRITKFGHFLRKMKIDEFPQLANILIGHMSFVGPRPDVAGFTDTLTGDNQIILSVRPGLTSPASLKFRDEEKLLATQSNAEQYNREVIYTEKVRLNREYIENYSFWTDIRCIYKTIIK